MKVSLNWLTDYVDISMPAAELGELLTRIGLNLEEIIETEADIVLDLEVTSNRGDCLGHLGVAREIAAATGAAFKSPQIGDLATSGNVAELTAVEVHDPDLCPRYTARVVRGVRIGPSPQWMVERLEAVGLRSINNVVDVTNFVLMEYSQPLHCFDYDKLAGHRIVVRRALGGETLVSIDETERRLDENMLIIADAEKAVAIAGIMGGLSTEVTDATTNVLIEAAQFDPLTTRHTSRKLQLMSDSNYRFERGVDPVKLDEASLRACQLIIDLAGGEMAEGIVDVWAEPWQGRTVTLRPQRCDALLGVETPVDQQVDILARLGLRPEIKDGTIVCEIPPHRADLTREADLIEEVARIRGYDDIPVFERISHKVSPEGKIQRTRRMVGEAMAAAGFDEAVTSSFVDAREAELFGWAEAVCVDTAVRKTNNTLRPSLLPSLLRACKTNQDAGNAEVSLFELADVFPPSEGGPLPDEHMQVGAVTTRDLRDLLGAMEAAAARVGAQCRLQVQPADLSGFAPGSSAEVFLDGEKVGSLGVIAVDVLDYYGLKPDRMIAGGSIRFDVLVARAGKPRKYQPVAKFPTVRRDLSLVVDEQVTWQRLAKTVAEVDQPRRVGIEYQTTYRGKQIARGKKSMTLTLTYRDPQATLRSEEVDQEIAAVVSAAKKKLGAELRS